MSGGRAVVTVSFDAWPIVVFELSGALTLEDAETIARESDRALARREPHVCIFDASRVVERPSPIVRKRLADYTAESGPASKRWTLGTAVVVPSALLRGVMTAIHWLAPPTIPVETTPTVAEALAWCRAKLAEGSRART